MIVINPYLKLFFGLLILLLGLGYIYRPDVIERVNRVLKETLLNDSYVSLHRRNWGFLLTLVGATLIYMGVSRLGGW
ncbi:MAG: hypothetical protein A2X28_05935 [Elusimicrobia bacterium GWA2_56_46]|nr:MAG: hypothetical protein A2X28_05935 [Elusimicrobia bacterium GWA2_56_46]OGR54361.1 MAG: hypothetical protein A2X39_06505 [Elusimicrobia bacterium GWC2_56_31]HBB65735.1 hypothetical protein [Elusimicrobiota bacterium]HBW22786.1 hypothetical protein [Elusimicrobiota bacterium]